MTTYLVGCGDMRGEGDYAFALDFTNDEDMNWRRITGVYYYKIEADFEEEAIEIGRKGHKEYKRLLEALENIRRRASKKYCAWPW
jgi:hypothetical protein